MKKLNTSNKIAYKLLFLLVFGLVFVGCKDKYKPEESFIKIYDDTDGNKNFVPLSMQRTTDQGYLVLSAYNGWNIHLLKTDKVGNMLWEFNLPEKYVNAVPNLIERDGSLFFVCMDAVGLFTYVMQVDELGQFAGEFQAFPQIEYPLYVADNEDAIYIQNYERTSYETGIYQLSGDMSQLINSSSVNIFTDVEDKVVSHLTYTGKRYPFSVSVTPENNHILISGFNNYSFSTVFLDANLDFKGVYNGAAFDGGLNAILPLGANNFAISRFSFTNLFFNPSAALSPSAIEIVESIPAQGQAELDATSPVLIKNIPINGTEYTTYLATTKSNQLVLNFYEKGNPELKGSKYLGQSVPLMACDFSATEDGGLMVLTRVTVMGSFNRIATLKLTKEELEAAIE